MFLLNISCIRFYILIFYCWLCPTKFLFRYNLFFIITVYGEVRWSNGQLLRSRICRAELEFKSEYRANTGKVKNLKVMYPFLLLAILSEWVLQFYVAIGLGEETLNFKPHWRWLDPARFSCSSDTTSTVHVVPYGLRDKKKQQKKQNM